MTKRDAHTVPLVRHESPFLCFGGVPIPGQPGQVDLCTGDAVWFNNAHQYACEAHRAMLGPVQYRYQRDPGDTRGQ